MQDAVIVSAARTPIGAINGSLASVKASQLGAVAVKGALVRAGERMHIMQSPPWRVVHVLKIPAIPFFPNNYHPPRSSSLLQESNRM